MRINSVGFKLFKIITIIWTFIWAIGNLCWVVNSSPYCFGESSVLKLYAYTAFQQGTCRELMHAPALFTLARPFIALIGCQPYVFAIIQIVIFLICASLASCIAAHLYSYKTGWLSFLLLTFTLGALQETRTFLLDYPLAIPLFLLYIAYLKSADFKKLFPDLLFSGALWLGAQTKYSFLPIWAAPLCILLLGRSLYRALHCGTENFVNRLNRAWKDDSGRSLIACIVGQISFLTLVLTALNYSSSFQTATSPHSQFYWQVESAVTILAAIATFYFTAISHMHPVWRRFYRCWSSCCLGLGLSAWSYTSNIYAVSCHTAANFSPNNLNWAFIFGNIPAAWSSYFSAVCQEALLPFPWAILAIGGLVLSLVKSHERQRSFLFTASFMISVLLQILPWEHAYQRFFAPLLPWLAILAARFLLKVSQGSQWKTALSTALILLMGLEAISFNLAWAWPRLSSCLPEVKASQVLDEGLSLNIPHNSRTWWENLQGSFHPLRSSNTFRQLPLKASPFYPAFFTLQPLKQPWFEELADICLQLSALGEYSSAQLHLIVIAELNGCNLKGESPAMELQLWCAAHKLSLKQIQITGINNPQAYRQIVTKWPNNLTVLISDTVGPSSRLQSDLYPWLESRQLIKQSQDRDSGLNLFYYGSDLLSRSLFPKS